MKILVDANVILDILQKREPYYKDSATVSKMCETDLTDGHISALTFANLVYIMRKELDPDSIEQVLKTLLMIFRLDDLTRSDICNAASLKWNDFEDAVQTVIAKRIDADYLITRNIKDYEGGEIKAVTPKEFISEYNRIIKK